MTVCSPFSKEMASAGLWNVRPNLRSSTRQWWKMGFTLLYTNPLCTAHSNTGWRHKQQPHRHEIVNWPSSESWSPPSHPFPTQCMHLRFHVMLRNNVAHTHCSISQAFSTYDVFSSPPAIMSAPFTYDHMTEASASQRHPTATGVITCHHHCTNTHTVRETENEQSYTTMMKNIPTCTVKYEQTLCQKKLL